MEEVGEQLVAVTALQGAGGVFALGGSHFGLAVVIGGVIAQLVCGCRLLALRARRRELCLQVIVGGRETLPLTCVQTEVWRLRERRTVLQLARALDQILTTAARPLPPRSGPLFDVRAIRKLAPELREVVSELRGAGPCLRGVAAVECLLTSSSTPLYGHEVEPLRQELGRVRYLLGGRA
jgi:hypothetical protein